MLAIQGVICAEMTLLTHLLTSVGKARAECDLRRAKRARRKTHVHGRQECLLSLVCYSQVFWSDPVLAWWHLVFPARPALRLQPNVQSLSLGIEIFLNNTKKTWRMFKIWNHARAHGEGETWIWNEFQNVHICTYAYIFTHIYIYTYIYPYIYSYSISTWIEVARVWIHLFISIFVYT